MRDVYYVPHEDNTAWGVFDSSDRIVGKPPSQKLLIHSTASSNFFEGFPFAAAIFRALGLTADDFVWSDRPMRIASLAAPHTSFRQQAWAHPAYGRLCRHIGQRMLEPYPIIRNVRPVWLSKSRLQGGVTRLMNEDRLEAVLEAGGVEIVRPETLSFLEQLHLFASRTSILGTTGSAFHLAAFVPPVERMIGLSWENAVNSNYTLIDQINGSEMACYHVPETRIGHDDPRFSVTATLSDPEQTARDLLALL